jgi:molybdate transport system ATP-binding protein
VTLLVDIKHRLGSFRLDARFAADGGLTELFGRSGAGKTSLINVIAGLIRPDQGRVVVDGVTAVDTEQGIFMPVHKRRVGYVFQDGRYRERRGPRHRCAARLQR